MGKLAVIFIAVCSLVLTFIWFKDGLAYGAGESGIPFYNMDWHWQATTDAWKVSTLGNVTGITTASAPTYKALAILEHFKLATYQIQAVIFFLAFFISGVSIFGLTKVVYPKTNLSSGLMAVFFYWFNPISLVNIWNRFENNAMIFFPYLPLAILLFLIGIKYKNIYFAFLVSLVSILFSYSLTSVPFNLLIWGIFTLITVVYFVLAENHKDRLYYFCYFVCSWLSFIAVNFWWMSQLVSVSGQESLSPTLDKYFSAIDNLSTISALSQRLGNISDIIILKHRSFFSDSQLAWRLFLDKFFIRGIEYVIMAIALRVVLNLKRNKELILMAALFLAGIFVAKGSNPPFGGLFEFLFMKLPVLQVFRNPFEKSGLLLALPAAILFSTGLRQIKMNHPLKVVYLIFICLFIIGVWGYPFWTGTVFTGVKSEDPRQTRSYKVSIPADYALVNSWFKKQPGTFRFLVLPIGDEGITYNWQNQYSGIELSSSIFTTPNLALNTSIPFYSDLVNVISRNQLQSGVLNFLPLVNAKYILWRSDIVYKDRRMVDPMKTKAMLENWANQKLLIKQLDTGNLAVYAIADKLYWPKMFITGNMVISNEIDINKIVDLTKNFPLKKIALIDPKISSRVQDIQTEDWIIKPTLSFPLPSSSKMNSYSDQEIIDGLPLVSHLPGDWSYPLARFKELLLAPGKSDVVGWAIHQVGILGKRSVEIYRLKKIGAPVEVLTKAESEYSADLSDLETVLPTVIARLNVLPDVLIDSLLRQNVLLARADSKSNQQLAKLLQSVRIKSLYSLPEISQANYLIYELNIPISGNYQVISDKAFSIYNSYLDGQPVHASKMNNQLEIALNKGNHELALALPQTQADKHLVDIENLAISNTLPGQISVGTLGDSRPYKISFDFRFKEGNTFILNFTQDSDRADNPIFSQTVSKSDNYHDWRHWEGTFTSGLGVKNSRIDVIAQQEKVCETVIWKQKSCFNRDIGFNVELRNITLEPIDTPEVYFTMHHDTQTVDDIDPDFKKNNPANYSVTFTKQTSQPQMLVFSELYNPSWQLLDPTNKVFKAPHILVNGYANGWVIVKPGNYQLQIKFASEDILILGKRISQISFAVISLLVIFLVMKKHAPA